jgi:hypothetical protein
MFLALVGATRSKRDVSRDVMFGLFVFVCEFAGIGHLGAGPVVGGRNETRRLASSHEQPGLRPSELPVVVAVDGRLGGRQRRLGVRRTSVRRNEVDLPVDCRLLRQVAAHAAAAVGQRFRLVDVFPT